MEKGQTPGFARLKQTLADLDKMLKTGEYATFVDNVSHFHQTLVEATGNKTLSFMNRMLLNLGRHHQNAYQRRHQRTSEDKSQRLRAGFKSFEKLAQRISASDVEGAVAHWRLQPRNAH